MFKHAQERGIIIMSVIAPEEVKEKPVCPTWHQSTHRHCPLLVEWSHLLYCPETPPPSIHWVMGVVVCVFRWGLSLPPSCTTLCATAAVWAAWTGDPSSSSWLWKPGSKCTSHFSAWQKMPTASVHNLSLGGGGCAPPKFAVYTNKLVVVCVYFPVAQSTKYAK